MNRLAPFALLALAAFRPLLAQQLPADVPHRAGGRHEPASATGGGASQRTPPCGVRGSSCRSPLHHTRPQAGNAYDLQARKLVRSAGFPAHPWAGQRSADSVAALAERAGASFAVTSGPDHLTLQLDAPSSEAALAFSLVGDAVQRPALRFGGIRGPPPERTEAVTASLEDDQALAGRVFLLATYADHPYGRRPTHTSVLASAGRISGHTCPPGFVPREPCSWWRETSALPMPARMARQEFGNWKGAKPPALPAQGPRRVAPGSSWSTSQAPSRRRFSSEARHSRA